MDCSGAVSITLDDALDWRQLARVDFVKLDVDGHEYQVLQGAQRTIRRFRPRILFELAPYVFADKPRELAGLLRTLWEDGYRFQDVASGRALPDQLERVVTSIPAGAGINVLASPR
jgi:hypothetical protein